MIRFTMHFLHADALRCHISWARFSFIKLKNSTIARVTHPYLTLGSTLVDKCWGGWMSFHFTIVHVHFVFLLIEFRCPFSISYKMLPYYVYYYCLFIR